MAQKCVACGSANVNALADRYQCLDCGEQSTYTGEVASPGLVWTDEEPAFAPRPGEKRQVYLGPNASTEQADAYSKKPDVHSVIGGTDIKPEEVRRVGTPGPNPPNTLVHPEATEEAIVATEEDRKIAEKDLAEAEHFQAQQARDAQVKKFVEKREAQALAKAKAGTTADNKKDDDETKTYVSTGDTTVKTKD